MHQISKKTAAGNQTNQNPTLSNGERIKIEIIRARERELREEKQKRGAPAEFVSNNPSNVVANNKTVAMPEVRDTEIPVWDRNHSDVRAEMIELCVQQICNFVPPKIVKGTFTTTSPRIRTQDIISGTDENHFK